MSLEHYSQAAGENPMSFGIRFHITEQSNNKVQSKGASFLVFDRFVICLSPQSSEQTSPKTSHSYKKWFPLAVLVCCEARHTQGQGWEQHQLAQLDKEKAPQFCMSFHHSQIPVPPRWEQGKQQRWPTFQPSIQIKHSNKGEVSFT